MFENLPSRPTPHRLIAGGRAESRRKTDDPMATQHAVNGFEAQLRCRRCGVTISSYARVRSTLADRLVGAGPRAWKPKGTADYLAELLNHRDACPLDGTRLWPIVVRLRAAWRRFSSTVSQHWDTNPPMNL